MIMIGETGQKGKWLPTGGLKLILTEEGVDLSALGISYSTVGARLAHHLHGAGFRARELRGEEDIRFFATHDSSHIIWRDGKRQGNNFLSMQLMVWDIDNPHSEDPANWTTINQVVELLDSVGAAYFIATTKSHMKEKGGKAPRPKIRCAVPFDRAIGATEAKLILPLLVDVLGLPGVDPAVKDLARYWSGAENSQVVVKMHGRALDIKKLLERVWAPKEAAPTVGVELKGMGKITDNRNSSAYRALARAYSLGGEEQLEREAERLKQDIEGYGTDSFPAEELENIKNNVRTYVSFEQNIKERAYEVLRPGCRLPSWFEIFVDGGSRYYIVEKRAVYRVATDVMRLQMPRSTVKKSIFSLLLGLGFLHPVDGWRYVPGKRRVIRNAEGHFVNTYMPPRNFKDGALLSQYRNEDEEWFYVTINNAGGLPLQRQGYVESLPLEEVEARQHGIEYMWQWLKYNLEKPGAFLDKHLALCGPKGVGKSLVFNKILGLLVGADNHESTKINRLFNDSSRFGLGSVATRTVLTFEEARLTFGEMKNFESIAKNEMFVVERKFQDSYSARRTANFVLLSNPDTGALKYLIDDRSAKVIFWDDPDWNEGNFDYREQRFFYEKFAKEVLGDSKRTEIFVTNIRRLLRGLKENYGILSTPTLPYVAGLARQDTQHPSEGAFIKTMVELGQEKAEWRLYEIKVELKRRAGVWSNVEGRENNQALAQVAYEYFCKAGSDALSAALQNAGYERRRTKTANFWIRK